MSPLQAVKKPLELWHLIMAAVVPSVVIIGSVATAYANATNKDAAHNVGGNLTEIIAGGPKDDAKDGATARKTVLLNGGWDIAKRLLQFERQNISAGGFGGAAGLEIEEVALAHVGSDNGKIADGDLRARISAHKMDAKAFSLTVRRVEQEAKGGKGLGPAASILKYAAATLNQHKHELMLEAMGADGLGWDGEGFNPRNVRETRAWLRSKGNSIEGGTSEINLNVVAKRVLGLMDHQ